MGAVASRAGCGAAPAAGRVPAAAAPPPEDPPEDHGVGPLADLAFSGGWPDGHGLAPAQRAAAVRVMGRLMAVAGGAGVPDADTLGCPDTARHVARFLAEAGWDEPAALAALQRYYVWAQAPCSMDDVAAELQSGKVQSLGKDLGGSPAVLVVPARHVPGQFSHDHSLQTVTVVLRALVDSMEPPAETVTVVVDLAGASAPALDTDLAQKIGAHVGAYFPGRLGRIFVINAGKEMAAAWAAHKSAIDERVLAKVSFLRQPKALAELVPPRSLPIEYGGETMPDLDTWTARTIDFVSSGATFDPHDTCKFVLGIKYDVEDEETARALAEATSSSPDLSM